MQPQELIDLGRKAGVPVLVDAAGELPPVSRLTRYSAMGADLINFSGCNASWLRLRRVLAGSQSSTSFHSTRRISRPGETRTRSAVTFG